MPDCVTDQAALRKSITAEASKAAGLMPGSWQERLFSAFFWLPAQRFSRLGAEFDRRITQDGISAALRWLLPRFASQVTVRGAENIPADGPVLLVSNHPGAFDGVVILAQTQRNDVKVIVSDVPFTRSLHAASQHMIFSTGENTQERMNAVRKSVRHLRSGGVLMLFPTGLVDPDPSFMPGAEQALSDWSQSLEFFLRQAPKTRLVPAIVSGIIEPRYLNNFFARRQKTIRSRQKLAEYLEIGQLMILQKDLGLTPRVSFGRPITLIELTERPEESLMEQIIQNARKLLIEHIQAGD